MFDLGLPAGLRYFGSAEKLQERFLLMLFVLRPDWPLLFVLTQKVSKKVKAVNKIAKI